MARSSDVTPAKVPNTRSIRVLREAARSCTACHLYENATQTVFGDGPSHPDVMVVGEQPGDQEDRKGAPFVGPAGRVLDRALERAGIDPDVVYRTNAVKHFKWRPVSGKRRLHDRPDRNEIEICKPWLMAEIRILSPRVIVALGSTAATSLYGKNVTLGHERGHVRQLEGHPLLVTYHPSSVLRMREDEQREARMAELVEDLELARELLEARGRGAASG